MTSILARRTGERPLVNFLRTRSFHFVRAEDGVVTIFAIFMMLMMLLVGGLGVDVMLQQQGVINHTLVWLGLVADDSRLVMINNQTGTIIAMTHILLPFMILPLYSVMKTIPPSYMRAARSLSWMAGVSSAR